MTVRHGTSSFRMSRVGDAAPHGPEPQAAPPATSARPSAPSRTYCFDSTSRLFPGVTIPLRSMLVAGGAQQILISPVGTPEEAAHIGAPLVLVASSLRHHRHFAAAIERYRPVELWGPPGLAEARPELGPVHVFGVDPWPYGDQLELVVIEGAPKCNEVVFFHSSSHTIYTTDLFWHVADPEGLLAPLVFRMMGIYRRFATAKMWRWWITDRAAFARSIEDVLGWDFTRIVVAHGDVVDQDARDQFESALRELELIE